MTRSNRWFRMGGILKGKSIAGVVYGLYLLMFSRNLIFRVKDLKYYTIHVLTPQHQVRLPCQDRGDPSHCRRCLLRVHATHGV